MEGVAASANHYNLVQPDRDNKDLVTEHTKSTVVPRILARGTCSIELHATNSTDVIFRHVPSPGRYRVPFVYSDFHFRFAESDFVAVPLAGARA